MVVRASHKISHHPRHHGVLRTQSVDSRLLLPSFSAAYWSLQGVMPRLPLCLDALAAVAWRSCSKCPAFGFRTLTMLETVREGSRSALGLIPEAGIIRDVR